MSTCFDVSINSDADSFVALNTLNKIGRSKIIDCIIKLENCNLKNINDEYHTSSGSNYVEIHQDFM